MCVRLPHSPGDDTLGHGASVCSTFLASDRDISTMGENTMSLRLGDERFLGALVDRDGRMATVLSG